MDHDEPMEAGYRRVAHARVAGVAVRAGRRPGRMRVERGDDEAFDFDEEGRLVRAEGEGRSWRVTFDLRLLSAEIRGRGPRRRLRRSTTARPDLERIAEAHALARALLERTDLGAIGTGEAGADGEDREWLGRAAAWTPERLREDRERARRLYQPIPVLPPDQYASLVLQMTEGCPWDRCTFCDFYRGVRHRIRSAEEFEAHLEAVLRHLGRSVRRTRRVFLGQANALLAGASILRERLDAIERRLPLCPESLPADARRRWRREHPTSIDGIYSFVDAFHRLPTPEDLSSLRRRGLRRVYLGLESGSRRVLEVLGKPVDPDDVIELVARLHAADVGVGIIVLVGAGGARLADEHEERTGGLLGALDLRRPDQIYLSRLVVHEGSEYRLRAAEEGLGETSPTELREQEERLRAGLRQRVEPGVVIAPYDLEQIAAWSPRP